MYKPFSTKQMQIMTWWANTVASEYDAIIADGSIRSGKTLCMSTAFLLWAMTKFDGMYFAICGKTVASCNRNVITPVLREMRSTMEFTERRTQNYIDCKYQGRSNRFYIFGGKDEGSAALIQGMTLAGVLLDEVALMPRSFVEQALGRCSVEGSKFWFNCNPEHPQHWFYQEWIKKSAAKKALYVHFTMEDNPTMSERIRKRYESMYSGVFYERYVLGRWIVAQGIIYPMFNKEFHVVPVKPRPYQEYQISLDYGIQNATAMGLWGLADGVWYLVKEYYHSGRETGQQKTDDEYYVELEKLAGNLQVKRVIVDPSAASFITLIKRKGKFHVTGADNAVIDGIRNVASALKAGKIKFNECCKRTIAEFGLYRWDEKANEDKPLKENDHCADFVRYHVYTNKISLPPAKPWF